MPKYDHLKVVKEELAGLTTEKTVAGTPAERKCHFSIVVNWRVKYSAKLPAHLAQTKGMHLSLNLSGYTLAKNKLQRKADRYQMVWMNLNLVTLVLLSVKYLQFRDCASSIVRCACKIYIKCPSTTCVCSWLLLRHSLTTQSTVGRQSEKYRATSDCQLYVDVIVSLPFLWYCFTHTFLSLHALHFCQWHCSLPCRASPESCLQQGLLILLCSWCSTCWWILLLSSDLQGHL